MKNFMKIGMLSAAFLTLAACGDAEEVAVPGDIDTGDVKGKIDLMGTSGSESNLNYNGTDFKVYRVEIGETAGFDIVPDKRTFEDTKIAMEKKAEGFFDDLEIISVTEDCIFYKENTKPFNTDEEEKTGYGFIRVVKKNATQNYVLESEGENPLDPIWSKANAEKLMKVAKSFKPAK